ncbi:MAG: nucleoside-diphosphate kinase [Patescibacteria group bacterium]
MEQSVYLIKPEGMLFAGRIRKMIEGAGLTIVYFHHVMINEAALIRLYPNLSDEIWQATVRHLNNRVCEIGMVEGETAIARLVAVCGESTNPSLCKDKTIRRIFSCYPAIRLSSGGFYFRNAIHRSKDHEEFLRDQQIYEKSK